MAKTVTTTQRRERYEARVQKAEQLIAESPSGYRIRLAALALLGYAVIFGVMFLLVAILGGTLWTAFASTALFLLLVKKKVIIVLAVMAWVLFKALWVRIGRPEGIRITAKEAPELYAEIRSVSKALDLPRIHEVLLTDEFNAGIAQSPRLGVLGWQRNSLILGIPLMLALSPEEMRAVIAHEAGHLSGNHSRFNGWIYRVRSSWYRIMEAFDDAQGFAVGLLRRFFDWYAPYFNAMSFALARANEYEADAVAVELTSPRVAASALVGATVRDDVAADGYWRPLLRRAHEEPEPEQAPYRGLARFHAEPTVDPGQIDAFLERALRRETDHSDTHPALRDRLTAIGVEPNRRSGASPNAAEAWLGDALQGLLAKLDADWVARNEAGWRQTYEETAEALSTLEALTARPRQDLEPLELWRLASLTEQYRDDGEALALFREYALREPDDRDASFVLGRLLLARDDAAGVAPMERAADVFVHTLAACEHLYGYYLRKGDEEAAQRWRLRSEHQIDLEDQGRAERDVLDKHSVFMPSELGEEWLSHLRDQLASRKDVRHAWIARKRVAIAPEIPLYAIAFQPGGWFKNGEKITARLAAEVETPGECWFVVRSGATRQIAKRIAKQGVQIF